MARCGVTCAATEYRVEGPRRLAQGERRKSRETFWRRRHLSWVGSKRKILLLWRKEGRKEPREETEVKRDQWQKKILEKRIRVCPILLAALTGLDNVRPTAQGSFLPSFHQDVRASSGTEPRSWWKDTQAYSLSKRQRRLSFFKMCKFNEIRDPFYAVWLSAAGERRRVPPSEQQPATDRAADTFDHF